MAKVLNFELSLSNEELGNEKRYPLCKDKLYYTDTPELTMQYYTFDFWSLCCMPSDDFDILDHYLMENYGWGLSLVLVI